MVGVDDIPGSALLRPSVTTAVRDTETLARGLAQRVVAALDGRDIAAEPVEDPLRLPARDSA